MTQIHTLHLVPPYASQDIRQMASQADGDYTLLYLDATARIDLSQTNLERMVQIARDTRAALLYADHYLADTDGTIHAHTLIDCQAGALRDEFDFGPLWLIDTRQLKAAAARMTTDYHYAGLYDLRLKLSQAALPVHVNECLYTVSRTADSSQGASHFAYQDPRNRQRQIEMELACNEHLKDTGAWLQPDFDSIDLGEGEFDFEASVIIPVKNRVRTVGDAIRSALSQETDFRFNVIVIDNHSTDGTTALVSEMSRTDKRLLHLVPRQTTLGIGGCWNLAVDHPQCGRFAVQLDSDDLYAHPQALQTMVRAFTRQQCAMVVGSYRITDFDLNPLPPGVIDHREWTPDNGRNNALRVNGLGAPRAFFTPLLRRLHLPDVSYGEDYAIGLRIARRFRIGRVYDVVYLCRRWTGNSDANLDAARANAHNVYKDRLRTWEWQARRQLNRQDQMLPEAVDRLCHDQLQAWEATGTGWGKADFCRRPMDLGGLAGEVRFNPARIRSTAAQTDPSSIAARPCFLCQDNRPKDQQYVCWRDYQILLNPYPIFERHLTIVSTRHQPQRILAGLNDLLRLSRLLDRFTLFYNGPQCGASAPDHLHFQACPQGSLPMEQAWTSQAHTTLEHCPGQGRIGTGQGHCPYLWLQAEQMDYACQRIRWAVAALKAIFPTTHGDEPLLNLTASYRDGQWTVLLFPRKAHRPSCYSDPRRTLLVSPAAVEMGGVFVLPREADYHDIAPADIRQIMAEVGLSKDEAEALRHTLVQTLVRQQTQAADLVSVRILSGTEVRFGLEGRFRVSGQAAGAAYASDIALPADLAPARYADGCIEWNGQRFSQLRFSPATAEECSFWLEQVTIGIGFHWEQQETQRFRGELVLSVEDGQLTAVNRIHREEYLASVISSEMSAQASPELLKAQAVVARSWMLTNARANHTDYDFCADDHCQRYQGLARINDAARQAIADTWGEVLCSEGHICDTRYAKCCGGVSETFDTCWDDAEHTHAYLQPVRDCDTAQNAAPLPDLTREEEAQQWIRTAPAAFCHTEDERILSQVLNHYDKESTPHFYRWQVTYTQEELSALIARRTGTDYGQIVDLVPLKRGASGRISLLQITGTRHTGAIGKELAIRRALSPSHLYSSAFVVDKEGETPEGLPARFILTGAGWGHGVGLCQIGAAVMAGQGYGYRQILAHYYAHAELVCIDPRPAHARPCPDVQPTNQPDRHEPAR